MAGFAAKILRQSALVYDFRWDDGVHEPMYIIFEADKSRHNAFLEAMNGKESFDFKEYGTIHHSGYGEPDGELKKELKERFGLYSEEEIH